MGVVEKNIEIGNGGGGRYGTEVSKSFDDHANYHHHQTTSTNTCTRTNKWYRIFMTRDNSSSFVLLCVVAIIVVINKLQLFSLSQLSRCPTSKYYLSFGGANDLSFGGPDLQQERPPRCEEFYFEDSTTMHKKANDLRNLWVEMGGDPQDVQPGVFCKDLKDIPFNSIPFDQNVPSSDPSNFGACYAKLYSKKTKQK